MGGVGESAGGKMETTVLAQKKKKNFFKSRLYQEKNKIRNIKSKKKRLV